jgi:hypothetical protein
VGAGLRLPAGSPTVGHVPSSPSDTGSVGGTSCRQQTTTRQQSTRPPGTRLLCSRTLTSGGVVSETFSFFATRFLVGLRGFLGGAARLASRLAGGSWMSGT